MHREGETHGASAQSLMGLDWLNFFLADIQLGVGPFLAIYLAGRGWNEAQVGLALTVAGLASVVTQAPIGAVVDRSHAKRALIAWGIVALGVAALVLAFAPSFWPVMAAQAVIGTTGSIFLPAVCAVTLGLVGRAALDARQGRNQAFNSAGNVASAVVMGLVGYYVSNRAILFALLAMTIPTLLALRAVRPDEIDQAAARGADEGARMSAPARLRDVIADRPLLVFLCCSVLFHFANAAMLPLLGQLLARGKGQSSMLFMSACVLTTQLVIALTASTIGRRASTWGRKPLLLLGFGVLPLRGVLYTLTTDAPTLIAIQILDGIGAGIFGVVSVLVIADRTRGTGRFNVTLGAINAAVGLGAALSQGIAGAIVHVADYQLGFLFLSGVATVAVLLLYVGMPETRRAPSIVPAPPARRATMQAGVSPRSDGALSAIEER